MSKNTADMLLDQCRAAVLRVRDYVETGDIEAMGPLEVLFTIDGRGRLYRVEIMLTCGGPTVWARVTASDIVEARGTWGGESCQWWAETRGAWDMLRDWCPATVEVV